MAIALTLGFLFAALCVAGWIVFGISAYKVYDGEDAIGWRISKWVCLCLGIIEAEASLAVAKLNAEAKIAAAEGDAAAQVTIAQSEARATKLKSIEVARMLGFSILENEITDDNGEVSVEYTIDFTGKSADEIAVISDYLKYIEYLSKWNGELPDVMSGDSATIIIPKP